MECLECCNAVWKAVQPLSGEILQNTTTPLGDTTSPNNVINVFKELNSFFGYLFYYLIDRVHHYCVN